MFKRSKRSNNPDDWAEYKKARNKAVGMLKSAKRKYYVSKLENNKNNAKEMWKTIKSISGLSKQSKRVNNLKVGGCLLEDNEKLKLGNCEEQLPSPHRQSADCWLSVGRLYYTGDS